MTRSSWTLPLPESAADAVAVVRALQEAGHGAYLVGGAVRDLVMGREPGDWDVACDAPPERIAEIFPGALEVGASFGVMLVPSGDTRVETATFREDGIYRDGRRPEVVSFAGSPGVDAARRDFTVNALYLDPVAGELLDPVAGLADAEAGVLRAVGVPDDRFAEDGLRLLRAARFCAQCDLVPEADTRAALARNAAMVDRLAAERIGGELSRILLGPRPSSAFTLMRDTGVLARFLPEVADLHGLEQSADHHPEGCVWTHTMLLIDAMENPPLTLALAGLLHDVGKSRTLRIEDGRPRFPAHARVGSRMADEILVRLRFPHRLIATVVRLVDQHMKFLDVKAMRPATLKRFLAQPDFELLLELHRLDRVAGQADYSAWEFCRRSLEEMPPDVLRPEPLLSGRDLLRMGVPRGPLVGVVLKELETAQLEGEITDRAAAEAYVKGRRYREE